MAKQSGAAVRLPGTLAGPKGDVAYEELGINCPTTGARLYGLVTVNTTPAPVPTPVSLSGTALTVATPVVASPINEDGYLGITVTAGTSPLTFEAVGSTDGTIFQTNPLAITSSNGALSTTHTLAANTSGRFYVLAHGYDAVRIRSTSGDGTISGPTVHPNLSVSSAGSSSSETAQIDTLTAYTPATASATTVLTAGGTNRYISVRNDHTTADLWVSVNGSTPSIGGANSARVIAGEVWQPPGTAKIRNAVQVLTTVPNQRFEVEVV